VVPVAIEGSWELVRYGMRPIPFGVRLRCTVLEPLEPSAVPPKELARTIEKRLRAALAAPGGC
jgi:1-acyl-sn-glycerol-3-phosphate acyltransferase